MGRRWAKLGTSSIASIHGYIQEELQEGDEEVGEVVLKQLWEPQACLVAHKAPGLNLCPWALTVPLGALAL